MKFVVFFAALIAATSAGVVDLTGDNFDSTTASGVWMIKFFAPWCGHCKRLAPTWEEFGGQAQGFGVAKVDCTQHAAVCTKFGVRGYPSLKLFVNGKPLDYSGARTIPAFEEFIKANAGDLITEGSDNSEVAVESVGTEAVQEVVIATGENFNDVVKQGKWLVKFYAPWCGHCKRLAPIWDELPKLADGSFGVAKVDCTQHGSLCQQYGVKGYPTIKYFQDGSLAKDYTGQRTADAFVNFVKEQ